MTGNLTAPNYLRSDGATIWHSGNDGSGSGLDADLLDGLNSSSFFCNRGGVPTSNVDFNTYNFGIGTAFFAGGGGTGNLNFPFGYGQIVELGTRNGGYGHSLMLAGSSDNELYFRNCYKYDGNGGGFGSWKQIAFTTSNVASATKLQTARTIAGVSFDGSANISIPFANLTAIPSTFAPSPHNHENIVNWSNAQTTSQTYSQLPNGVSVAFTDEGGGYGSFGSVLNVKAYPSSGGGTLQLYIPYSNTYGGTGLKYRKFNYAGNWGSLNTIWDSGNLTNLNQLTTRNFSDLQNKPTTLGGYGITDGLLASTYTATDVLTKLKTVDGAGSELDADTLDGLHSSGMVSFSGPTNSDLNNLTGSWINSWNYDYATSASVLNQPSGNNVSDARGVLSISNGYRLQIS